MIRASADIAAEIHLAANRLANTDSETVAAGAADDLARLADTLLARRRLRTADRIRRLSDAELAEAVAGCVVTRRADAAVTAIGGVS